MSAGYDPPDWMAGNKGRAERDFNRAAGKDGGKTSPADNAGKPPQAVNSEMVAKSQPRPYPHPKGAVHTEAHRESYYRRLQEERNRAAERNRQPDKQRSTAQDFNKAAQKSKS